MRLPSQNRQLRFAAAVFTAAAGAAVLAVPAGAASSSTLSIAISGNGPAFTTSIEVQCESPAVPAADGVDIAGAATASRHDLVVPAAGSATVAMNRLADDSACAITTHGPLAKTLTAVDGGIALVGSDGQLRGVAVMVNRGTPMTAHLTHTIPVVLESKAARTASASTTTTAGSGSAASNLQLPASDEAASAAASVALAAARSTTTASSAALPDTSGSGTTLVLASVGVLLCGAWGYGLALTNKRGRRTP